MGAMNKKVFPRIPHNNSSISSSWKPRGQSLQPCDPRLPESNNIIQEEVVFFFLLLVSLEPLVPWNRNQNHLLHSLYLEIENSIKSTRCYEWKFFFNTLSLEYVPFCPADHVKGIFDVRRQIMEGFVRICTLYTMYWGFA